MRFRCERDVLAEALAIVSRPAAGSRSAHHGVASGVKAELTGERLQLMGTDLELTITAALDVRGDEDGRIVIPAKANDIVRSLDSGAVDVVSDQNDVRITAGRSEFSLKLIPSEQWPQLPEPTGEEIELDAAALADGLGQVVKAASRDDSRSLALTGVLFSPEPEGLRLVATDSYRLAMRDLAGTAPGGFDRPVLIPSRALTELGRMLAGREKVTLLLGDSEATFRTENLRLTTRLIEQSFPNYRDLIPTSYPNKLMVGRLELLDAVKRVRVMAGDGELTPMRLDIGSDSLDLTVSTRDLGDAHEALDAKYEGEDMRVAFNAKYFTEGLEVSTGDEVTLEIISASKAALMRSAESSDFLYLLMPVNAF